jgi:2-oxoglutarate ferredoxin oxidoreductase subunit alpha
MHKIVEYLSMLDKRISVKFTGPSGKGINTLGEIFTQAIKDSGFFNFGYREYPSLIKGGKAAYQIDIADKEIYSSLRNCNILALLTNNMKDEYLQTANQDAVVIHGKKDLDLTDEDKRYIEEKNLHLISLPTTEMALDAGGIEIMANMVLLGFIWKLLDLKSKPLEKIVRERFKEKDVDLDAEVACLLAGYNSSLVNKAIAIPLDIKPKKRLKKALSITGNQAIALGAISAGCRAYYAYPMTPATSIFKFLGDTYKETGILVKQAENEITAAQMVMGSMNMGTRAMTATSGGGLDLMSETISCSGISETPMVLVLAQRAGAGTGVPTWTGAGDLHIAINAGHGEFPRCVISVSDPKNAYILTQQAFNIAEVYQIPVILITEKQIAESIFNIQNLPKPIEIKRGLQEGDMRYQITESGISPRWAPSKDSPVTLVNSDEHTEQGISTEQSKEIIEMSDKRLRKLQTLRNNLPEPRYFGSKDPDTVFVGYGSAINPVKDIIDQNENIGCLQYEYLYPLKYEKILELYENGAKIVSVENNQTGEFSKLIRQESGFEIKDKILKYNARPLFIDDILDYLNN